MQEPKNWYGPGANFIRAVPKIERSVNGASVTKQISMLLALNSAFSVTAASGLARERALITMGTILGSGGPVLESFTVIKLGKWDLYILRYVGGCYVYISQSM
jgi:hypothetical protein